MKIVHLVLKYKWFDLIDVGMKKIEYRDNTPRYKKLLIDNAPTHVRFQRGYSKNAKQILFKIDHIVWNDIHRSNHPAFAHGGFYIYLGERVNE